jgi:hypothetical protein
MKYKLTYFEMGDPGQPGQYSGRLQTERPGFDSRYGQDIFIVYMVTRTAVEPTRPPIQWVPGAL